MLPVRPQNLTQANGRSRRSQHNGPAFTPSAQLAGVTNRRYPAVSGAPTAATTPQPRARRRRRNSLPRHTGPAFVPDAGPGPFHAAGPRTSPSPESHALARCSATATRSSDREASHDSGRHSGKGPTFRSLGDDAELIRLAQESAGGRAARPSAAWSVRISPLLPRAKCGRGTMDAGAGATLRSPVVRHLTSTPSGMSGSYRLGAKARRSPCRLCPHP